MAKKIIFFGSTGPYKDFAAFGMVLAAVSEIPNFICWPDRVHLPVGVAACTDCISPRYEAAALIAALDHRNKTGRGQLTEISQLKTAISFIFPGILDFVANGREPVRSGNSNPYAVPHGVYPCKGEDACIRLSVNLNMSPTQCSRHYSKEKSMRGASVP
jgi:benzylsuccinate CoA-transferase BbsF subunit